LLSEKSAFLVNETLSKPNLELWPAELQTGITMPRSFMGSRAKSEHRPLPAPIQPKQFSLQSKAEAAEKEIFKGF